MSKKNTNALVLATEDAGIQCDEFTVIPVNTDSSSIITLQPGALRPNIAATCSQST